MSVLCLPISRERTRNYAVRTAWYNELAPAELYMRSDIILTYGRIWGKQTDSQTDPQCEAVQNSTVREGGEKV